MILQMVVTILIITTMMKMITMIVIIMMIFMIKIIMRIIKSMVMIMIAVMIRQLYAIQCNLGELEITAGRRLMTRRKCSMIESNFLQLIHLFLNPTANVDYVSLVHENIHIPSQNLHCISAFKYCRKDIMEY